jgi:FkbM family methyltransferase
VISRLLQKSITLLPWNIRGAIKHVPGVAYVQRQALKAYLDGHEFLHVVDVGPARGLKFPVLLPEDKGVWTGTYESRFTVALASAVRPGNVCFDIGGWRGYFSGVMALAGASKVVVFEPMPENAARIRKMIDCNPDLAIELVQSAVAESDGRLEFLIMPESSMGKLAESTFQPTAPESGKVTVNVVSLDSMIEASEIAPPDVVKIDIEGAELLALRGFAGTIEKHKPALFIEIHSRQLAKGCKEFLERLGYNITVLETECAPDLKTEPAVCHFVAKHPERQAVDM